MSESSAVVSSVLGRRKCRRYELKYPVHLKFGQGDSSSEVQCTSRNLSLLGLLLDSPAEIPADTTVNFTIEMQGAPLVRPIHLQGIGKIKRVDGCSAGFAIAVTCEHPITELDMLLPQLS